ncbi:MAG TPA: hypothetical protein VGF75_06975 [Candidatus Saccharimonadales bacterium]
MTTETDIFYFATAGFGAVNSIAINVSHTGSGASGICTAGPGNTPTFYVCCPKVGINLTNFGNTYIEQLFDTQPTIQGCDDFTQVQFQQVLDCTSNSTTYTGTVVPDTGDGGIYNTSGNYTVDIYGGTQWSWATVGGGTMFSTSGQTAQLIPYDVHGNGNAYGNFMSGGTTYYYAKLASMNAAFKDQLRRTTGTTELSACEYNWGYIWNNSNATWTSTMSPSLSLFTSYKNTTPPSTSAVYGGPTQNWTGQYTSQTPASLGLPTTHTP